MRLKDSLKTATAGLRHAKVRSLLTMLGIVIGIASVILLMSIGKSAEKLIINQVESVGSNLIFVIPGGSGGSRNSAPQAVQGVIIKTLKESDLDDLNREPAIEFTSPEVRGGARAVSDIDDVSVTYQGVENNFFPVRNMVVERGMAFTKSDVESFNRVAVVGYKLADTLFGTRDPLGRTFRMKGMTFRVVGILEKKGVGIFGVDQDNLVLVPITVAQKQLLGIDYYHMLTVQVDDNYNVDYAQSRMASILRQNHRITDPDKDDFTIRTQEDALEMLETITSVLTIFLTAIASISLIVGGIGIMNIMLVSVVERTREIGLRKAIGATNRDIMQQFLLESVIITFFGGLIGIFIGGTLVTVAYLILANFTDIGWVFALPIQAIILAVTVAAVTGIIFGIYPARQAARKNPIDALRYE